MCFFFDEYFLRNYFIEQSEWKFNDEYKHVSFIRNNLCDDSSTSYSLYYISFRRRGISFHLMKKKNNIYHSCFLSDINNEALSTNFSLVSYWSREYYYPNPCLSLAYPNPQIPRCVWCLFFLSNCTNVFNQDKMIQHMHIGADYI